MGRDGRPRSAWQVMGAYGVSLERLMQACSQHLQGLPRLNPSQAGPDAAIIRYLNHEAQYSAYLKQQEAEIAVLKREQEILLPTDLDYWSLGSLSNEERQKLSAARPASLAAASRIPGITPSSLLHLHRHAKQLDLQQQQQSQRRQHNNNNNAAL